MVSIGPQSSAESIVLSQGVEGILDDILDATLRGKVEWVVRYSLASISGMERIHLPQDHFEERAGAEDGGGGQHLEIAPYVLGALAGINQLLRYLLTTFPAPAEGADDMDDFDLEFDLVDEDGGGALAARSGDAASTMTLEEQIADAAHAYGGMLRARIVEFGNRLATAVEGGDGWKILGELDDLKHRVTKAIQGVLFGVLAAFAADAKREDILPQYTSAVSESVALRSAITDLGFHISRFNESLGDPEIAAPLLYGLSDRLARFSARPVYRTLRAEDKRAVIDFRRELYDLRYGKEPLGEPGQMIKLRRGVEGFSKFLDSMQAINHREVLVIHDRRIIEEALSLSQGVMALLETDAAHVREQMDEVVLKLKAVMGRNPELDDAMRAYDDSEQTIAPIETELQTWVTLLHKTLSVVG